MKKVLLSLLICSSTSIFAVSNNSLHRAVDALDLEKVQEILDKNPEILTSAEAIRTIDRINQNKSRSHTRASWLGAIVGGTAGAGLGALLYKSMKRNDQDFSELTALGVGTVVTGLGVGIANLIVARNRHKYRMLKAIFAAPLSMGQLKILRAV